MRARTLRAASRLRAQTCRSELAVLDLHPSALAHRKLGRIPDVMHLELLAKAWCKRFSVANRFSECIPRLCDRKRRAAMFDSAHAVLVLRRLDLLELALQELGRGGVRRELLDIGARTEEP